MTTTISAALTGLTLTTAVVLTAAFAQASDSTTPTTFSAAVQAASDRVDATCGTITGIA